MTSSLVPSEDIVLVMLALATDAAAFVTSDRRLLDGAGLSLSLNHRLAFVHPNDLSEALCANFDWRWQRRGKDQS